MTMTTASLLERAHDGGVDEIDPAARPRRRTFTAEYKRQHPRRVRRVAGRARRSGARCCAARACTPRTSPSGARPATPAPLAAWRPKARPPKRTPEQVELERLRRRNERLEAELARTKLALEITGKAHALLELLSESAATDPKSKP